MPFEPDPEFSISTPQTQIGLFERYDNVPDFGDVPGQTTAKRALEVAVAMNPCPCVLQRNTG